MSKSFTILIVLALAGCASEAQSQADEIRNLAGSSAFECVAVRSAKLSKPTIKEAREIVSLCGPELELYSRRMVEARDRKSFDPDDPEMMGIYTIHQIVVADHLVEQITEGGPISYD